MKQRGSHRKLKLKRPEAPPGWCKLCGEEIIVDLRFIEYELLMIAVKHHERAERRWTANLGLRADRRNWHPQCAWIMRNTWGTELRRRVQKRDRGKCAECGTVTDDWEADHIKPLIDGSQEIELHLLSNVQTLCKADHAKKTAKEARRRAKRRKRVLDR